MKKERKKESVRPNSNTKVENQFGNKNEKKIKERKGRKQERMKKK